MYKYGFSGRTKSTKKRLTRYSDVMANEDPFIKRCSKNVNDRECKFHCSIRNINLSYAHGGINANTAGEERIFSMIRDRFWITLKTGWFTQLNYENKNVYSRIIKCVS